ncbi:MAG: energy transducer TonB [Deltaproteobacteria bacterium]|nr:energy transducer TonB [Deltaproteobacteria bacterium]
MTEELKTKKPKAEGSKTITELFLTIERPERASSEFVVKKGFSLGTNIECDLYLKDDSGPKAHTLIPSFTSKTGAVSAEVLLTADMRGTIKKGFTTARIEDLIELGLLPKKGSSYVLTYSSDTELTINTGKATITFGTREVTLPPPPPKIKHNIPFLSGGERSFLFVLIGSFAVHFIFVLILNSVEIVKPENSIEALKKLDKRFARLILKPKKKAPPKAVEKPKEEEVKEEEEVEDTPLKEKRPERKMTDKRQKIVNKVQKKGILGVIGAKGGLLSSFGSDSAWRDIDQLMAVADVGSYTSEDSIDGLSGAEKVYSVEELYDSETAETRTEEEMLAEKAKMAAFKKTKKKRKKSGSGARDIAEVDMVIKRYSGGIKYLYNNALRKDPMLRGSISVDITISEAGKVTNVRIISSSLKSPDLENAIKRRIRMWKFRAIKNAGDFTIDYTFDFSPVG